MCDEAFRKRWKEDVVIYKKKGKYSCFPSLGKLDEETVAVQFDTRDKPTHYQIGGGSKEDPCINLWFQTGLQRHSDQKCKRLKEGKWHCQK